VVVEGGAAHAERAPDLSHRYGFSALVATDNEGRFDCTGWQGLNSVKPAPARQ
jgi:hypothetical protein